MRRCVETELCRQLRDLARVGRASQASNRDSGHGRYTAIAPSGHSPIAGGNDACRHSRPHRLRRWVVVASVNQPQANVGHRLFRSTGLSAASQLSSHPISMAAYKQPTISTSIIRRRSDEADAASLEAERAYARISVTMTHQLTARMPLILVANNADAPRTAERAYQLVAASSTKCGARPLLLSDGDSGATAILGRTRAHASVPVRIASCAPGLRRVGVRVTGRPSQRDVAACGACGGTRCADRRPCACSREPDCLISSLGTCNLRLHRLGTWRRG